MMTNSLFYSIKYDSKCILNVFLFLGGFAFVFVAQDTSGGKEYALKVFIYLYFPKYNRTSII